MRNSLHPRNAYSTRIMVTENNAYAVITPSAAKSPLTIFPAVFKSPELLALCAIKLLFDHEGGALAALLTVRLSPYRWRARIVF